METITPTKLADVAGISVPYASQLLSGVRTPSQTLAIHLFRRSGWKHPTIAIFSDDQLEALASMSPWVPRVRKMQASNEQVSV